MKNIAVTSLVATGGMTLFSYLLSKVVKKNFLEPVLLNQLIYFRQKEKKKHHITGYMVHSLAGFFFTSVYSHLWKSTPVTRRNTDSMVLGFINGVIGVSGWHLTFLAHPSPPKVNRKQYYLQLLAAHVVFGFLNGWSNRKLKSGSIKEIS